MEVLLLVVGAMLATVLLVGVGDRLRLPWPVLLLVLGAAAAFVPGVDAPPVDPELILPLFLPPLLFATAQRTSWALFRARWRAIVFLAVGLVLATAAAVAGTVWVLVPGIGVAAAIAVGAAVAPPDPVAVEAVAGPLGVPRRLVATLQSEGLFNDATALVLFQVATTAAVAGTDVGAPALLARFIGGALAAVAVGLVSARVARALAARLTDPTAASALTLVLPFAVYLGADAVGASGVIAVVVAALQTRHLGDPDDSASRLTGSAFWRVVEMLVTGVAFALIGLELRSVVADAGGELGRMLAHAGVVCAVVVGVRAVWMTAAQAVLRRSRAPSARAAAPRGGREAVVMTWAGMRGLATLALALALPTTTADGAPFPGRVELVLTAGAVLVVTLVGAGLTLPAVLRGLGVREGDDHAEQAERALARRGRAAALAALDGMDRTELGVDDEVADEIVDAVRGRFVRFGAELADDVAGPDADPEQARDHRERVAVRRARREVTGRVRAAALAAARREITAARHEPGTDPEVADAVMRRLDVRSVALGP